MSSYTGSLRIAATNDVVEAVFDVSATDLTVTTGGEQLGRWPLDGIEFDDTGTEMVYLSLDGEQVVVSMTRRDAFIAEIASPRKVKSRHTKPARPQRDLLGAVRRLVDRDTWRSWLSTEVVGWVIACTVVIIVALLALFATASFGMVLILLGMIALVIAALAVSEDLTAVSWVPGSISEVTLVIVGASLMAVGGLLVFIS